MDHIASSVFQRVDDYRCKRLFSTTAKRYVL